MNEKPDLWRCECGNCYPDQESAHRCCQLKPKPEPPLDFAELRSNIEIVSGMSVSFEIAEATGDEFSIDELRALKHVTRDVPSLIDMTERCVAAEKERDRRAEENAVLRRLPQGEMWYWQGDGTDFPESLACPVIMKPEALRELLAERDRLNTELAALKSSPSGLTNAEEELVAYLRGVSVDTTEKRLVAIIDRLKSAAPTLNWRKDIPIGTEVVYAVRPGGLWAFDYGRVVDCGVERPSGYRWEWSDGILAIPFDELAATLPDDNQQTGGST